MCGAAFWSAQIPQLLTISDGKDFIFQGDGLASLLLKSGQNTTAAPNQSLQFGQSGGISIPGGER